MGTSGIDHLSIRVEDALDLENEFKAKFTAADLENIGKHQIYLKLVIDGVTSQPFSAKTILPKINQDSRNNMEGIIKTSRQKYGVPRGYCGHDMS